ncbi:MAG: hypothetical protein E6H10_06900 [Bacteroidetes bacterium]|nr:MAG: hypothetical protein E6H10_06900 [Bacteroidota bacterium]
MKISITIFLFLVSLFCAAQMEMSYGGYYVSVPDSNSMSMFKYYLRFYPDGTVIGVTTAGKPTNLIPWFKKENNTPSKGKYTLTDSTIKFSMTSEQGEVNYMGRLTSENKLVLNVKSLINKYEAKEEYGFMKMEAIKTLKVDSQ